MKDHQGDDPGMSCQYHTKHWSDCIDHVKQVEKVYWASDIARDEMLEPAVITLTESDAETDTADEFGDVMSSYTSTCIVQK